MLQQVMTAPHEIIFREIEKPVPSNSEISVRAAQNSDAKKIASLCNSELINIYKGGLNYVRHLG